MILVGPRLWRRNSQLLAACTESGFEPYLFGPALPRRQPISTNPQIESATPASARTQCSPVPAAPANQHLSPAGPALPARLRTPAATTRFSAVMQSLSVESDAPQQPWDEDDREHEDEERCGEAGRSEQNDAHEQPGAARDEKRAPVFGPIDAAAGAEQ